MNGSVRLGPLALIFTIITMCLSVLAILTFTTARADLRVAEKYAQTVQQEYALEAQGQRFLQTAAQQQPDDDGAVHMQIQQDGSELNITLQPAENGAFAVSQWRIQHQWVQDTTITGLWQGAAQENESGEKR